MGEIYLKCHRFFKRISGHEKDCDLCHVESEVLTEFRGEYELCFDCLTTQVCKCPKCSEKFLKKDFENIRGTYMCPTCVGKDNREYDFIWISSKPKKANSFRKNRFRTNCGVEIECINDDERNSFTKDELKKLGFMGQQEDGSLPAGGFEFASRPANGDALVDSITRFCRELKRRNYYITTHCGTHIHLQVDKTDLKLMKKLFIFYKKYEGYFFAMLPFSRRNNDFCSWISDDYHGVKQNDILESETIGQFMSEIFNNDYRDNTSHVNKGSTGKRYCWVNFESVFYRGTLEIRSHSGTIEEEKILNWMEIHCTILSMLQKMSIEEIKNLKANDKVFLKFFSPKLKKYIVKRAKHFKEKGNQTYIRNSTTKKEDSFAVRNSGGNDVSVTLPIPNR